MALIIEDGSVVVGANSYVTLNELTEYAAARKIELSTAEDDLIALLLESYDFVSTYEDYFAGIRVSPLEQTGAWPRKEVVVYGAQFPENEIPTLVKTAQIQIAVAASTGIALFPSQTSASVSRETVGPITTVYATDWVDSSLPVFSNVEATLGPLFDNSGSYLRVVRV